MKRRSSSAPLAVVLLFGVSGSLAAGQGPAAAGGAGLEVEDRSAGKTAEHQGGCVSSPEVLCLQDGRFRVEVEWRDFDDRVGSGKVIPTDLRDSGIFWFFEEQNWELLVKVLDGCSLTHHFWVFSAATTNVEYTLRVTDTRFDVAREYFSALGRAARALTDTSALATCSPLQADFSWSPLSPDTGQTVHFSDRSTGDPTAWLWRFGDGATSTLQDPTHAYQTPGPKTVELEVSGPAGTAERSKQLTVGASGASCGVVSDDWPEVRSWRIDADGDELPDLLALSGRSGPARIRVWRNRGGASFSKVFESEIDAEEVAEAAVADFDGDGRQDFVVAAAAPIGGRPGLVFFESLPDGSYRGVSIGSPLRLPLEMATHDIDGDGLVDLLVSEFDIGLRTYVNRGSFDFRERLIPNLCEYFGFGDFDGDGKVDALCGDVTDLAIIEDIAGAATDGATAVIRSGEARTVRARDLDADGRDEMLVSVFSDSAPGGFGGLLEVYELQEDDLALIWSSQVFEGFPYGAQVCDYDGDSVLDLLFSAGGVRVLLAAGDGYDFSGTLTDTVTFDSFVCADMDADGDADLVTSCRCGLEVLCREP